MDGQYAVSGPSDASPRQTLSVPPRVRRTSGTMTLSGQVAIVTGGARGIGLAIARSLARSGSSLAVLSRSLPDAEAAAATLPG